jgi:hypothetical protein
VREYRVKCPTELLNDAFITYSAYDAWDAMGQFRTQWPDVSLNDLWNALQVKTVIHTSQKWDNITNVPRHMGGIGEE